jgi:protein gp37
MSRTSIEWCQWSLNPGIYGCEHAKSPACDFCYAAAMAARLERMGQDRYAGVTRKTASGVHWNGVVRVDYDEIPRAFGKLPKNGEGRVFVTSMADVFHPLVPDDFVARCWAQMTALPNYTFLVLTKHPDRIAGVLHRTGVYARAGWVPCPVPNIWLGATVEDQASAWRVPALLNSPGALYFLSCEPLRSRLDLRPWLGKVMTCPVHGPVGELAWTTDKRCCLCLEAGKNGEARDLVRDVRPGVGWVITGGESGPKARPSHPAWFRRLHEQCFAARVPFFFKQWGAWQEGSTLGARPKLERVILSNGRVLPAHFTTKDLTADERASWAQMEGAMIAKVGKKAAGRQLDGRTWDDVPRWRGTFPGGRVDDVPMPG